MRVTTFYSSSMILSILTIFLLSCGTDDGSTNETDHRFSFGGTEYELVKTARTWEDAASDAVARGGMLAEIESADELNALYNELQNNAEINIDETRSPDGGGAAYVWLGGNDISQEGSWLWDGNHDASGNAFWSGRSAAVGGTAVNGAYSNWGDEPDDFLGKQDGLGLALTNWPLGSAGQWNDVDITNQLYYLIEYP